MNPSNFLNHTKVERKMTQILELIRSLPAVIEGMIDALLRDIIYCFRKKGSQRKHTFYYFFNYVDLIMKPLEGPAIDTFIFICVNPTITAWRNSSLCVQINVYPFLYHLSHCYFKYKIESLEQNKYTLSTSK